MNSRSIFVMRLYSLFSRMLRLKRKQALKKILPRRF